jgi:hypothetical protein
MTTGRLHFSWNDFSAVFRAEHAMHAVGNVGVRHARDDNTSIVPPGLVVRFYAVPGIPLRSMPG